MTSLAMALMVPYFPRRWSLTKRGGWLAMEALVSHLVVGALGAGMVWRIDRRIRRQFKPILKALSEGKKEGQDWRLVTNDAGEPEGIRIMYRASAPGDDPKSH